ncbi:Mob1/phocein [Syncephalis fuscata]|nr:Mob1/phocein [Syncephalis fuscata]
MSQSSPPVIVEEGSTVSTPIVLKDDLPTTTDVAVDSTASNTLNEVKPKQNNNATTTTTTTATTATTSLKPRRNRPGTKGEDCYQWRESTFEDIKSPLALQEYLLELVRVDRSNVSKLLQMPPGQNEEIWQYEHLRMLCMDINYLVIQLEIECTKESCPEMKADEWLFLCAAHLQPQACCAIDYAFHTLDGATSLLNSHKYFPSRLSIMNSSLKHFQSIARRLYRIFAHAWYHHREEFNSFEASAFNNLPLLAYH